MYSSNITRVPDGYDCWGRREFTNAYEIKHNGKSIIKIKINKQAGRLKGGKLLKIG